MKRILLLICCIFPFLCGGCQAGAPLSRQTVALDTPCTVTLYAGGSEELLDECMRLLAARDDLWSRTKADSAVSKLNTANGEPYTLDADTAALLRLAVAMSDETGGTFDITALPLTLLWESADGTDVAPSNEAFAKALQSVGSDNMLIDGSTVTLQNGAMIDLGGIAKGQVADDLAALLKENGCTSAIISLGGNAVVIGEKPNGEPFHVGIADPRNDNELIATVAVRDCSAVTSGSYIRGYTVGGKRYSHILDPKTGKPVENDLLSVTILCASSAKADALSTACFVMGFDKAKAYVEAAADVEAVFVRTDGTVVATAGVMLV